MMLFCQLLFKNEYEMGFHLWSKLKGTERNLFDTWLITSANPANLQTIPIYIYILFFPALNSISIKFPYPNLAYGLLLALHSMNPASAT